jgi:hypothetical protein
VRIAREHRERLRTRVEHSCRPSDGGAQSAVHDLFFRDEVAILVAPAVADANVGAGLLDRADNPIRIGQRERDRLLHQYALSELDRPHQRLHVLAFARGNHDRVDVGVFDNLVVIAAVKLRTDLFRERSRMFRTQIGDRDKPHRRMRRGKTRAQRSDATRAHNGKTYRLRFAHGLNPPER